VRAADFERALGCKARAQSAHFAIHYVPVRPSTDLKLANGAVFSELSTDEARACPQAVDESLFGAHFGVVVPKRHAQRAVTRNMLKRQVRAALARAAPRLAGGLWLVRLRAPFDRAAFPSADSPAARLIARSELDSLVRRVIAADVAP